MEIQGFTQKTMKKKAVLGIVALFLFLGILFTPSKEASADALAPVTVTYYYLNNNNETMYKVVKFTDIDSEMLISDFFTQYVKAGTAEIEDLKKAKSWTTEPYCNDGNTWDTSSETMSRGMSRYEYFAVYDNYYWGCYWCEVKDGEESWLDSGTGFMVCVPATETEKEITEAVYKAAMQWPWMKEALDMYQNYTVKKEWEGTEESYTGFSLLIKADVKLDPAKCTIKKGKKKTLTLNAVYLDYFKLTWKTSDKSVATVKNGVVTAKGKGTCKITVTYNGHKYTCKVTVK